MRCIVRLDETCRDVRNAARVIGDPVLYKVCFKSWARVIGDCSVQGTFENAFFVLIRGCGK